MGGADGPRSKNKGEGGRVIELPRRGWNVRVWKLNSRESRRLFSFSLSVSRRSGILWELNDASSNRWWREAGSRPPLGSAPPGAPPVLLGCEIRTRGYFDSTCHFTDVYLPVLRPVPFTS